MRVTLIYNPSAGALGGPDAEPLERLIRSHGHQLTECCDCKHERLAAVLSAPADLVAVAGGDGTLARIAKAMIGREVPIAALPLGTANNIAASLGLAGVPLEELVSGWDTAKRLRVDAGTARAPWGSAPFIEGVGAGLFAFVMPRADEHPTMAGLSEPEAKVAYGVQMLKERLAKFPERRIVARLDGKDVSGAYVLFEALNTRYIGPNLYLAPGADSADGCFELVTVGEDQREALQSFLSSWQNGWHRPPDFPSMRGRHLELDWDGYELHLDDGLWPEDGITTPPGRHGIEIAMDGASVEFLAPPAASA